MIWMLILAVFLFVACAVILVLEIFVPSFGLLTAIALISGGAGILIFFSYGTITGWIGVAIAVVVIPIVWVIVYRLFPKTRFGRHIILDKVNRAKGDAIPDTDELKDLLGAEGVVLSPLRPVGICDFSRQRVECVADTGYIEKDEKVTVVRVQGTQLTVRLTEQD